MVQPASHDQNEAAAEKEREMPSTMEKWWSFINLINVRVQYISWQRQQHTIKQMNGPISLWKCLCESSWMFITPSRSFSSCMPSLFSSSGRRRDAVLLHSARSDHLFCLLPLLQRDRQIDGQTDRERDTDWVQQVSKGYRESLSLSSSLIRINRPGGMDYNVWVQVHFCQLPAPRIAQSSHITDGGESWKRDGQLIKHTQVAR